MSGETPILPASPSDPAVLEFIAAWGLPDAPILLPYSDVGAGYGSDWCHVSSKAHAMRHGGRRVHGWALWYYEGAGVMGNFHSIWEDPDGVLVDVTPPKFQRTEVMFVRDREASIVSSGGSFVMPQNRMAIPVPIHVGVFDGAPTDSPSWSQPCTAPAFLEYCRSHSLAVTDYATDAVKG